MAVNINVPSQVKTYANLAAFPATGALKTIYIAEDTNKTYRWTGSIYTEISASAAMTWGAIGGTLSNQTDLQSALNAKQDSLGFTPVPTTRTLTINGTTQDLSADRTFTISTGITIGTTAITSGTVGRVLFQGAGNVVQQSSQLSWDNTNNALLVTTGKTFSGYNSGGSASDALKLELTGNGAVLGIQNSNASGFSGVEYLNNAGAPRVFTGFNNSNGQEFRFNNFATGGYIDFLIGGTSSFRVFNSRNIGIGTTTDAGFKFDVNGTARVVTSLVVGGTGSGSLTTSVVRCNFLNTSDNGFSVIQFQTANGNATFFQSVSIGSGANPVASAQLEVSSTTKGFLPPRMTNTQKLAIASPATGLVVYDTTLNKLCVRTASSWETITSL